MQSFRDFLYRCISWIAVSEERPLFAMSYNLEGSSRKSMTHGVAGNTPACPCVDIDVGFPLILTHSLERKQQNHFARAAPQQREVLIKLSSSPGNRRKALAQWFLIIGLNFHVREVWFFLSITLLPQQKGQKLCRLCYQKGSGFAKRGVSASKAPSELGWQQLSLGKDA